MHIEFDITWYWVLYIIVYLTVIPAGNIMATLCLCDLYEWANLSTRSENFIGWIFGFLWPITLPLSIIVVFIDFILYKFEK